MATRAAPRPETTIALIFGTRRWPDCPKFQELPSLERSADAFQDFLRRDVSIPRRNIKSFFGSDDDAAQQLGDAQSFVNTCRRNGEEAGAPISDLIFYYAGHGDFEGDGQEFYLSIRRTHVDQPLLTSITARSLGNWVRKAAADLRTYFILDCCFAAALQYGFLSSPVGLAERRISEALPNGASFAEDEDDMPVSGAALLAAAGANQAAIAAPDEVLSRFTGALLQVLRDGDPRLASFLSVSDLHRLVSRQIDRNFSHGSRPELLPLKQGRGRVEFVPLFANPANVRGATPAARPDTAEVSHRPPADRIDQTTPQAPPPPPAERPTPVTAARSDQQAGADIHRPEPIPARPHGGDGEPVESVVGARATVPVASQPLTFAARSAGVPWWGWITFVLFWPLFVVWYYACQTAPMPSWFRKTIVSFWVLVVVVAVINALQSQ